MQRAWNAAPLTPLRPRRAARCDESLPPGFPRCFVLREFFSITDAAHARLKAAQAELHVADDAVVSFDAAQLAEKLPGVSLPALQAAATALASAGFADALRASLRLTDALELPRNHFAGEGAGLFARVPIQRGQVLGLYGGRYELEAEAEAEQRAELTADPERATPPRILAHLFELDVAQLIVDAMDARDGARCWGGCVNASRRDAAPGDEGAEANVVFVRGVRGARVPAPELPGTRMPLLFCLATRDIDPGAELLMDYGAEYWDCHEQQQRRVAEVKREEIAKRNAPARVAARAECDCLRIGSGITPELCPRCNPAPVLLKGGRTLRLRQHAAPPAGREESPPAKRSRRSLSAALDANAPMQVEPPAASDADADADVDADALVRAACDGVPCRASLLALHREMAAVVVPEALRSAADAAAAAAERARHAAALCDGVRNAAAEPLRAALLEKHGAALEAESQRAAAAAAAAEESRAAAERDAAPLLALHVPDAPRAPGFDAATACARFSRAEPAALLRAYRLIALPRVAAAADELPRAAAARCVVTAAMASIMEREARDLEAALARDVPQLLAQAAAAKDERFAQDVRTHADALLAAARAAAEAARAEESAARAAYAV